MISDSSVTSSPYPNPHSWQNRPEMGHPILFTCWTEVSMDTQEVETASRGKGCDEGGD